MAIKRLDLYIEMERNLSVLRTHFELCRGAAPAEVQDWAKFFHQWSKGTAPQGGPWSEQNLLKADRLVNQLKSPKDGFPAFDVLVDLMEEAAKNMREEILEVSVSLGAPRNLSLA